MLYRTACQCCVGISLCLDGQLVSDMSANLLISSTALLKASSFNHTSHICTYTCTYNTHTHTHSCLPLTYSLAHSLTHSLTHPLIHSLGDHLRPGKVKISKVSHGKLLDLVKNLSGRLPPGISPNTPPAFTVSEKINKHYSELEATLDYLK